MLKTAEKRIAAAAFFAVRVAGIGGAVMYDTS